MFVSAIVLMVLQRAMSEQVVRLDPNFGVALAAVDNIYPAAGTWRLVTRTPKDCVSENLIRDMVHQLGNVSTLIDELHHRAANMSTSKNPTARMVDQLKTRLAIVMRQVDVGLDALSEINDLEDEIKSQDGTRLCPKLVQRRVSEMIPTRRRRSTTSGQVYNFGPGSNSSQRQWNYIINSEIKSPLFQENCCLAHSQSSSGTRPSDPPAVQERQPDSGIQDDAPKPSPTTLLHRRRLEFVASDSQGAHLVWELLRRMSKEPDTSSWKLLWRHTMMLAYDAMSVKPNSPTFRRVTQDIDAARAESAESLEPLPDDVSLVTSDTNAVGEGDGEGYDARQGPGDELDYLRESPAGRVMKMRMIKRRIKRFNPIGWLGKNLLGLASSDDIDTTNDMIHKAYASIDGNTNQIQHLTAEMTSIANALQDSVDTAVKVMNDKLATVRENIDAWIQTANAKFMELDRTTKNLWFMQLISVVSQQLHIAEMNTALFMNNIHQLTSRRHALLHLATSRQLDGILVSKKTVIDTMKVIQSQSSSHYILPPTVNPGSIMQAPISSLYIAGGEIRIITDIPLSARADWYQTLKIVVSPIPATKVWMKLDIPDTYVIVRHNPDEYALIQEGVYDTCRQGDIPICTLDAMWHPLTHDDCLSSSISDQRIDQSLCFLQVWGMPSAQINVTRLTAVIPGIWLVATRDTNATLMTSCFQGDGEPPRTRTSRIPHVTIIMIPAKCYAVIGGYKLEGSTTAILGKEVVASPLTPLKFLPIINNMTDLLSHADVKNKQAQVLAHIEFNNTRDRAHGSELNAVRVRVQDMLAALQRDDRVYITDQTKLREGRPGLNSGSDPGVSTPWWLYVVYSLVAALIMVALLCILKHRFRSTAGAATLVGMVPSVRALEVSSACVNVTNSTTLTEIHECLLRSIEQISREIDLWRELDIMFGEGQQHVNRYWPLISLAIVMTAMLVAHCTLRRQILALQHCLSSQLHFVPLNKKARHHPGESRLIGTFEVQVAPPCGMTEIVCIQGQIATLPGGPEVWSVRKGAPSKILLHAPTSYWWSPSLSAALQWGPLCIIHTRIPNLDTCQSLPQSVKFDRSEVLMTQLEHMFRWPVTMKILALSSLNVKYLGRSNMIWECGLPDEV